MIIRIRKISLTIYTGLIFAVLFFTPYVFAQDNSNCKEMVIDEGNTMKICDEIVKFKINGQEKEVKIKSVYSEEYIKELIKSGKYLIPLDKVGFFPDKTPKTYLVSYINNSGCIDSNEIEYEGKPSGKKEICFCELDLDRNIAAIYHQSTTDKSQNELNASTAFYNQNKCDVYVPREMKRPTPQPQKLEPTSPPSTPTEEDQYNPEQCLINQLPNTQMGNIKGFIFPLMLQTNPENWQDVIVTSWHNKGGHIGMDYAYPQDTPVIAAQNGVVEIVQALTSEQINLWTRGYFIREYINKKIGLPVSAYGNFVVIRHEYEGKKYYSYYAHLNSINVKQGEKVGVGQKIGTVGNTGNSSGPHLHFEIRACISENTGSESCTRVDPQTVIVFSEEGSLSNIINYPKYDQECLERLNTEKEKAKTVYNKGDKFECMFKAAADSIGNITGEAVYAIAKQESGSSSFDYFICPKTWDSWRNENDRQQCENNPLETALASRNGYNEDLSIDVRGLTQFQATTFSSLVKSNRAEIDKCIEDLGGKTTISSGSELYDDAIDEDLRVSYSRHAVSHIICATAVKLKQNSTVFKERAYETGTGFNYKFTDDGLFLSQKDWNEIVLNNYTAKLPFKNSDGSVAYTENFNALDYVGHRYHGSCRSDIIMRGTQTYYQAYCEPVNNYYKEAYNSKIFEGCGINNTQPTEAAIPSTPYNPDKTEAQYCSKDCIDCKYFPVSKTNTLRSDYSPNTEAVPASIYQHEITDILNNGRYVPELTKETIGAMQELFNDAQSQGISLALRTSYRSYQYQEDLFESYVTEEMNKGKSRQDAEQAANQKSAKPGSSEHQLGTTADVTCKTCTADPFGNNSENKKAYDYLAQSGYKFGFIVSYTSQNQSITGFIPEGWHIRYIGEELAAEYKSAYDKANGKYSLDKFFESKCEN